jgi:DMSO/TMAO reductase YedYZ molybdopterin-dependent catalytic subunit
VGAVCFYFGVYDPFAAKGTAVVSGSVAAPFTFAYHDWQAETVSVRAELRGSVTYVPPTDYIGVPVRLLLARAAPTLGSTSVRVIAADGYEARFTLEDLTADSDVILVLEGDALRLVASDVDGASWVRQVVQIVVE